MTVASRLWISFALLLSMLAAVVAVHVAAMRSTVHGTRALSAIASRQQAASAQGRRLDDMSASIRKYAITRDPEYLERLASVARLYESQIRAFEIQALTPQEEAAARDLALAWTPVSAAIDSLVIEGSLRPVSAMSPDSARRVADEIDGLAGATDTFAAATRFAMLDELRGVDRRAASTTRLFWMIAVAALLMVGVLATVLVRSIVVPLDRLARATREIARGHFGAQLPASGTDELATVARDFNEMSARLEQLDRMKRDFISNVSHDLKSPLAAIQEANDALLDGLTGPLGDRQRRLLEMSRDSGRRLASMIHKLLDLSRLDARPTPARELLDLWALTQRAIDHVNATRDARGRGPTVIFDQPVRLLLRADAEEIAQVLDNLLENAVKFSPNEGTVRVTLDDEDGVAVLRVADQGPGVPDAERHRIFERFYQADAGRTTRDHGVGLGLAICRHVVDAHGGSIAVHDNEPAGAIFEVRIPGAIAVPLADAATFAETLT